MYQVININTGKIYAGLFDRLTLTQALESIAYAIANTCKGFAPEVTVKQAIEAGYRIVEA